MGQASGTYFEEALKQLQDHPLVGDIRARGLLAAIELVVDEKARSKPSPNLEVAAQLAERGAANRLIFRAFADDIIGLAPPLIITRDEIDTLIARLEATLDDLLEIKEIRHALV